MEIIMRETVISAVEKERVIVIVRGVAREKLISLAEAMYEGGIRLLEITYDATGRTSDEETAANIKMLSEHFGGRMLIGAGTVLKKTQVELTARAGGLFIISPDTNKAVIEKTRELGLVSMPGALTPTEIADAHRYGADFVKLFPISTFGTEYVKAVKAPLSHVKLLAVGGIDENNIADYAKAGVCGFGIGSNIVNKSLVEKEEYGKITELARTFLSALK